MERVQKENRDAYSEVILIINVDKFLLLIFISILFSQIETFDRSEFVKYDESLIGTDFSFTMTPVDGRK